MKCDCDGVRVVEKRDGESELADRLKWEDPYYMLRWTFRSYKGGSLSTGLSYWQELPLTVRRPARQGVESVRETAEL